MADRRITFRVAAAEGNAADAIARDRGYITVSGRPNVSRLMRELLSEEINRNPPSTKPDEDRVGQTTTPKKRKRRGSS